MPRQTGFNRVWLALSMLAALALLGYVARDRVGGFCEAAWAAAHERVAPMLWEGRAFSAQEWRKTPIEARYSFVRDLRVRLKGLSESEVAALLDSNSEHAVTDYPVKRVNSSNLWYVLHLDFADGRVSDVDIRMTWLDP